MVVRDHPVTTVLVPNSVPSHSCLLILPVFIHPLEVDGAGAPDCGWRFLVDDAVVVNFGLGGFPVADHVLDSTFILRPVVVLDRGDVIERVVSPRDYKTLPGFW